MLRTPASLSGYGWSSSAWKLISQLLMFTYYNFYIIIFDIMITSLSAWKLIADSLNSHWYWNHYIPDAEKRCKDRSIYLGEIVVAVVDRLQLVELWKSVPRDLKKLVEWGVEKLDPFLVFHRDLTKQSWSSVDESH